MAPWGDAKLFFCILFITCCCTVTVAELAMDCCLEVKNRTIDKSAFADFHRQVRGHGCALDAMILVTRVGRGLCVPADEPWVHTVVTHVKALKKICKKYNYKGNRCKGVKHE